MFEWICKNQIWPKVGGPPVYCMHTFKAKLAKCPKCGDHYNTWITKDLSK